MARYTDEELKVKAQIVLRTRKYDPHLYWYLVSVLSFMLDLHPDEVLNKIKEYAE